MSTLDWATPATNEAMSTTGTGGLAATTSRATPTVNVPISIFRPRAPPASRAARMAPASEPSP